MKELKHIICIEFILEFILRAGKFMGNNDIHITRMAVLTESNSLSTQI